MTEPLSPPPHDSGPPPADPGSQKAALALPASDAGHRTANVEPETAASAPRPGSPRWLYVANARIPSEKAHVYQIFQMVDALRQAGVEVELAYPARANVPVVAGQDPVRLYGLRHPPLLRQLLSVDAVRLVTIDVPALNHGPLPSLAFGLQSASFAATAAVYARRSCAGAIYSRDWPILLAIAAVDRRHRLVWEAHDLPQGRRARAALRRLLPRLAGVVSISTGLRDEIAALEVSAARLLVAPDAVDLSRFQSAPAKAEARALLGLPASAPVIAYTGHLYAWKGAHTLALASRHLPDHACVCIVGGTPADLASFRDFVQREQLDRVRVVGYVSPAHVPVWLAAADVLALPNSGRETISARYTSPLKLFEYMAAQRPIVASDLPSLREVLAHGRNALLVPPDDPPALAAGLRTLLADERWGARLAEAARRDVRSRTWDARAAQVAAFVERLPPR